MLGPKDGNPDPKNPWFSPGTAPIFSPCGTFGGNPLGCRNGDPTERYGDCCGGRGKCGGCAFGVNAETIPHPNAPITEWDAGSVQEVAWYVNANHAGGYSYRLCKLSELPGEEISLSMYL